MECCINDHTCQNKIYNVDQGDGNILEALNNLHFKLREKEII